MPARSGRYRARRGGGVPGAMWAFAAVVAAILILVVVRVAGPKPGGASPLVDKPVAASLLREVTTTPTSVLDAVGTGGINLPSGGTTQVWKDSAGKPVVFYLGAEYCPFCAASRWVLVAGLGRFGTWRGLRYWSSSSTDVYPSTPTFTFLHASFSSPYVDFQGVEQENQTFKPLQTPTATQQAMLHKYGNTPYLPSNQVNSYPFIDVGNRFLWGEAVYSPGALTGQLWPAIAASVHSGQGPAGQAILAGANVLAAAVCAVDGGKPASVCTTAGVRAAAAKLPPPNGGKAK